MSSKRTRRRICRHKYRRRQGLWMAGGVAVLIFLLILWLTLADMSGNTDVAAIIPVVAAVGA